ncbi:CCT domain-containing protein [Skeletonema marinoi]|uniref:CCT domain-containing protein n=1 Tax=Skeletonema marinoi TaxID=267567 RepID=A0AAD8XW83_9STRA|nr:CCT domain-containing protein [Skeletonema marinoi]
MVATRTGRESKAAPGEGSVSSHGEHSQHSSQQGNLGSLLTHYEHTQKSNNHVPDNNQSSSFEQQQPQAPTSSSSPAPLTIDIPSGIQGGVKEEDRDRSLTMGSEFDQIFSHLGKDGRGMSISGLLTPLGDAMSEGTSTTAISGSTSSTYNSVGVHNPTQAGGAGAPPPQSHQSSHLPRLPEYAGSSSGIMAMDTTPITSNYTTVTSRAIPSISGRLRSMSDLEDNGVISRDQKALLKDLIIAGDSSVQGAIDKYESGDTSALEEMIKSGALLARSSDVDLLGDLDLDFLNVGDDTDMMFGDMEGMEGNDHAQSAAGGGVPIAGEVSRDSVEPIQFSRVSRARGDSIDDINLHRMRANSLALPGFLLDGANPDDAFGQWLDQNVTTSQQRQNSSECDALMGGKNSKKNTATATNNSKSKAGQTKTKKDKKDSSPPTKKKDRKPYTRKKDKAESSKKKGDGKDDDEPKEVQSGLGRPRSMSDPNLTVRLDEHGLLDVKGPEGWVGAYSPTSRELRINKFLAKRNHRVWVKKVKYDVRKNFADSRLRVKGRFVKKEDEMLMRELMSLS